jgi:hypothetical protein
VTQDETHDRARYRRGCRCDTCREANRLYQREHRQKAHGSEGLAVVTDLPSRPPTAGESLGTVVEAVEAQITAIGSTTRPALVAIARVMAEGLDNPAALARQLVVTLGQLGESSQRRGRLASVQRMTERKPS